MSAPSDRVDLTTVAAGLPGVIASSVETTPDGVVVQLVAPGTTPAIDYRHRLLADIGAGTPLTVLLMDELTEAPTALTTPLPAHRRSTYAAPTSDIEAFVCATVAEAVDLKQVGVQDDLFDLDADSLVLIELTTAVSERYGVQLDVQDVFEASTVGRIAALVTGSPS